MTKKQIKGLDLKELIEICIIKDVPSFRAKQIYQWMYRHHIDSISQMNNIPVPLRDYIDKNYILNTLKIENIQESELEDTKKILFRTNDGQFIESVSMIDKNLHTVCISSQIGCSVDCKFCATGMMGFKRNLTCGEIIDQIIQVTKLREKPITNIVYMGMGEPFLNYNEVIKSAEILHNHNGMNLGKNRITISTSGIIPKIKQFINEKHGYKLAISLNATDDKTRTQIIPINKKWNIKMLIDELEKYPVDKKNMIMLEYVLLKGINDSKKDAEKLSYYGNHLKCKVNIIPFNDIGNQYKRPDDKVIKQFIDILHKNQKYYQTLVRWSKGIDIDAACGQLSTNTL